MSKGLRALKRLSAVASMYCDDCATSEEDLDRGMFEKDYQAVKTIEKELKALEIIKRFVWIENGEIHLGLYGDSEIVLKENDFESKEEYDLLKEVLL